MLIVVGGRIYRARENLPRREFLPRRENLPRREFFPNKKSSCQQVSLKPANEALNETRACNGLSMVESSDLLVVGFDIVLFQTD